MFSWKRQHQSGKVQLFKDSSKSIAVQKIDLSAIGVIQAHSDANSLLQNEREGQHLTTTLINIQITRIIIMWMIELIINNLRTT